MTDLNDFALNSDTFRLELQDPKTGEILYRDDGEPMTIEVYGEYSDAMRRIERKITDRNIARAQGRRGVNLSAEQLEAQTLERISASVKSWTIVIGGITPEVTPASVREILTSFPWIREQVEAAVYNSKNFMKS